MKRPTRVFRLSPDVDALVSTHAGHETMTAYVEASVRHYAAAQQGPTLEERVAVLEAEVAELRGRLGDSNNGRGGAEEGG